MPFLRTQELMQKYGKKLQDGTISDEELKELLAPGTFKRSGNEGYVDRFQAPTEANHTDSDEMQDFVITLAANMDPRVFHQVTERAINLATHKQGEYMRNNSLDKVFLAYELAENPKLAAEHFRAGTRIRMELPEVHQVQNLLGVILGLLIANIKEKIGVEKSVTLGAQAASEKDVKVTNDMDANLENAWAEAEKEVNNNVSFDPLQHFEPEAFEPSVEKVSFKDRAKIKFEEFKAELQELKDKITGAYATKKARDEMVIKRVDEVDFKGTVLDDETQVSFKGTALDDDEDSPTPRM